MKTHAILRVIASIVIVAFVSTQCGIGTSYALRQETTEAGAGGIGKELGVAAQAGAIGASATGRNSTIGSEYFAEELRNNYWFNWPLDKLPDPEIFERLQHLYAEANSGVIKDTPEAISTRQVLYSLGEMLLRIPKARNYFKRWLEVSQAKTPSEICDFFKWHTDFRRIISFEVLKALKGLGIIRLKSMLLHNKRYGDIVIDDLINQLYQTPNKKVVLIEANPYPDLEYSDTLDELNIDMETLYSIASQNGIIGGISYISYVEGIVSDLRSLSDFVHCLDVALRDKARFTVSTSVDDASAAGAAAEAGAIGGVILRGRLYRLTGVWGLDKIGVFKGMSRNDKYRCIESIRKLCRTLFNRRIYTRYALEYGIPAAAEASKTPEEFLDNIYALREFVERIWVKVFLEAAVHYYNILAVKTLSKTPENFHKYLSRCLSIYEDLTTRLEQMGYSNLLDYNVAFEAIVWGRFELVYHPEYIPYAVGVGESQLQSGDPGTEPAWIEVVPIEEASAAGAPTEAGAIRGVVATGKDLTPERFMQETLLRRAQVNQPVTEAKVPAAKLQIMAITDDVLADSLVKEAIDLGVYTQAGERVGIENITVYPLSSDWKPEQLEKEAKKFNGVILDITDPAIRESIKAILDNLGIATVEVRARNTAGWFEALHSV